MGLEDLRAIASQRTQSPVKTPRFAPGAPPRSPSSRAGAQHRGLARRGARSPSRVQSWAVRDPRVWLGADARRETRSCCIKAAKREFAARERATLVAIHLCKLF